ncbi:MAG: hypothetical protein KAW12_28985 [Candidatus Aminicenantes bacterium]|nr:hypothetical protein [Candidatus Aminicenantes bacterium]
MIENFVIFLKKPPGKIKDEFVEKYIRHGEKKVYKMGKKRDLIPSSTDTCASRKHWYQLPDIKPAHIFWQKAFDISHRHYFSKKKIVANQRFYPIYPNKKDDIEFIAACLNSTLTVLYLEFQRAAMGQGAIEATVDEVKQIFFINPLVVKTNTRERMSNLLAKLGQREMGSVFEEIGAETPADVSLKKIKPDRRELDKIVMGEILGLNEEEQLEIYRAVIDLVKSRTQKAGSVAKKKKTAEGIDIDLLKDSIVDHINNKKNNRK